MGLEAATVIDELNVNNPADGDPRSAGDDHLRMIKLVLKTTFPGMAGRSWRWQGKSSNYSLVATDNMTGIFASSGAIEIDLLPVVTVGNGFAFLVGAHGAAVTLVPDGSETINGVAANLVLPAGSAALVTCSGADWSVFLLTWAGENFGVDSTGVLFSGQVSRTGTSSPSQITGNQNNYSLAASVSVLRLNSDARRSITGLTGGTSGRVLAVYNVGAFPIDFTYEDSNSTAANRFTFAFSLGGGQVAEFIYDSASSRWRAKSLPEPLGTVKAFAGPVEPGFLAINQNYSRTTYANLFNVIGTTFGVGDGSSTFGLFMEGALLAAGSFTQAVVVGSADVDTTGNTFLVPSNQDTWVTGMKVQIATSGGLPSPLASVTDYWVIRVSATTIRLATTLANAQNGSNIDITTQGSGNHTITHTRNTRTPGERGGEDAHAMSSAELLAHSHTLLTTSGGVAGLNRATENTLTNNQSKTTEITGGNAAMNIMSPYSVINRGVRYV